MKYTSIVLMFFPIILFAQVDKKVVKYEGDNYTIEYPVHWVLDNSGEGGTELFLYPKDFENRKIFTENINLIKQNLNNSTVTIENHKDQAEKQINKILIDVKIINSEIKYHEGLKMHLLEAEGYFNDNMFKIIYYTWFTKKYIYILNFTTLLDAYENNHIECLRIMDSFKLTEN